MAVFIDISKRCTKVWNKMQTNVFAVEMKAQLD